MSLRSMFLAANEQNIKYVVLNDNDMLPETVTEEERQIRILVAAEDKGRLIKVFRLLPTNPSLKDRCEMYNSEDDTIGSATHFRIIAKGRGYFPETFETRLLATRHLRNKSVQSPAESELIWIVLHEYHKHGYTLYADRCQKIIKRRLETSVGKSTYRNPHAPLVKKTARPLV